MSDLLTDDMHSALDPVTVFRRALDLEPMAHQVEYLRSTRPMLINKGRQSGFTTAAAMKAVHLCWYHPNTTAAFVSPSQRQSANVSRIARQGLRALGARLEADSVQVIQLANGSRILSLPGRQVVPMVIEFTGYERPRMLASTTRMSSMDIRYALTFDPVPRGTRMRWAGDVAPKGFLRLMTPVVGWMGRRQELRIWTSLKHLLEGPDAPAGH